MTNVVEVEEKVADTDELLRDFYAEIAKDRSWVLRAACRGLDPNMFHPGVNDMHGQRKAMAVCNGEQRLVKDKKTKKFHLVGPPPCPVKDKCYEYIMSMTYTQDVSGIYAGMTHRARRTLRAKLNKKKRGDRSA